ncbi:hypothetical protein DM793_03110 [Paenarthrobacter nitroguajacolicus]|uniref:nuclear transport factor 2 family protein n=1 Tax=Paenarthrobacter nitroguajacolicus TaxID=211146 RepID=UPI0015BA1837|nr:nuclear transport factor 2 family protein [Paenarthrobacter nitroguajacolicus]NWL10293.1 hypothetical protein [Paenarthrobacter nitroguajacolicus]
MAITSKEVVEKFLLSGYKNGDIQGMAALVHPDGVFHEAESLPFGGDWRGPEGLLSLIEAITSQYTLSFRDLEVLDCGDRAIVKAIGTFVSKKSGASMDVPMAEVYTIRDGLILDADVYHKEAAQVAALHDAKVESQV